MNQLIEKFEPTYVKLLKPYLRRRLKSEGNICCVCGNKLFPFDEIVIQRRPEEGRVVSYKFAHSACSEKIGGNLFGVF